MFNSLQFLNRRASSLYRCLTGSVTVHSRLNYWKGKIERSDFLKANGKSAACWNSSAVMESGQGHTDSSPKGPPGCDHARCRRLQPHRLPSSSPHHTDLLAQGTELMNCYLGGTHVCTHSSPTPQKKQFSDELSHQTGKCQSQQSSGVRAHRAKAKPTVHSWHAVDDTQMTNVRNTERGQANEQTPSSHAHLTVLPSFLSEASPYALSLWPPDGPVPPILTSRLACCTPALQYLQYVTQVRKGKTMLIHDDRMTEESNLFQLCQALGLKAVPVRMVQRCNLVTAMSVSMFPCIGFSSLH